MTRRRPTRHQLPSGFTTRMPRGYIGTEPEIEGPPTPHHITRERDKREWEESTGLPYDDILP